MGCCTTKSFGSPSEDNPTAVVPTLRPPCGKSATSARGFTDITLSLVGLPSITAAALRASGSKSERCNISRRQLIFDKPGKVQDTYNLSEKKLGQGAYGAVRKATHKDLGQERAIKTISKCPKGSTERFRREIDILKTMDHPNILKLFETFEDSKNVYLVTELCSGGEIFCRIVSSGQFTESAAAHVMQQVVRAIFYMHGSLVVHRDLKPENFLLQGIGPVEQNVVKIIDFGLSRRYKPGEVLTTKVGTPYYVAPQVLSAKYDHRCDLWSCGVIMYILLAGYPPFSGKTSAEVFAKVKSGYIPFKKPDWKFISKDALNLIRCLLTQCPRERYTAEQTLTHDWIKQAAPRTPNVCLRPGFLDSLRRFRSQGKLKKAALHIIAGQASEERIQKLRDTFLSLDCNGDGLLTLEELQAGLAKAGIQHELDELKSLMDGVDSDGSGMIDYSEFLAATLDRETYLQEDVCRSAFRVLDQDGDGSICSAEIAKAFGPELAERVLRDVDQNGDGAIDFCEFMAMMRDDEVGDSNIA